MKQKFTSIEEAHAAILANEIRKQKEVVGAMQSAAEDGANILRHNVPVAFGELRDSIHVETERNGAAVVVDAPHAVDVEIGSRPHLVPLEDLVAWVKLRGMQFLSGYSTGTTSEVHAHHIGTSLDEMSRDGYLDIDAPEKIARAIQQKILREGTAPQWYARNHLQAMGNRVKIRLVG